MNNMADFRFQYSRFDSKNGQYVVRSNDVEEFELDIEYLNKKIGDVSVQGSIATITKPVTADDFNDKHMCPVHNVEMASKMSKKTNKPYYSHFTENKEICFGKGALPSKF
jgi:hypothetical protein